MLDYRIQIVNKKKNKINKKTAPLLLFLEGHMHLFPLIATDLFKNCFLNSFDNLITLHISLLTVVHNATLNQFCRYFPLTFKSDLL